VIEVESLTNENLLLNADAGPSGEPKPTPEGFEQITLTILGAPLGPGEFIDIPFVICLQEIKPFSFSVNVLGREG
jgi:hypothetical protein